LLKVYLFIVFLFSTLFFAGSQAGMIWGIFCTLLFCGIILSVLLYYRRRVANLKAEIGHVVRYMSDDPRNFDNPVYSYQPSVNTDTSTLLHRNGMNNLRQTKPSNLDRLNNFDHDSNSSGRAGAYSLQYDSELMNQKNHAADLTNPNLYYSIDDHLYDEIKLKCADLGEKKKVLNNIVFIFFIQLSRNGI
jgi:multiple epidermal growth factor-like domains protein 10/11